MAKNKSATKKAKAKTQPKKKVEQPKKPETPLEHLDAINEFLKAREFTYKSHVSIQYSVIQIKEALEKEENNIRSKDVSK